MAVKMAVLMVETWIDEMVDSITGCWGDGMCVLMAVLRTG